MGPLFPSSSSLTSPRAGEARGEGLGGPEAGAWRGWGPVWVVPVGTAHREGEGKARGSGGGADGGGTYPWAEGWGEPRTGRPPRPWPRDPPALWLRRVGVLLPGWLASWPMEEKRIK